MKYYVIDKDNREDVPLTHMGKPLIKSGWRLYFDKLPECWDMSCDRSGESLVFDTKTIHDEEFGDYEVKTLNVDETLVNIYSFFDAECEGYIKLTVEQAKLLEGLFDSE